MSCQDKARTFVFPIRLKIEDNEGWYFRCSENSSRAELKHEVLYLVCPSPQPLHLSFPQALGV